MGFRGIKTIACHFRNPPQCHNVNLIEGRKKIHSPDNSQGMHPSRGQIFLPIAPFVVFMLFRDLSLYGNIDGGAR